MDERLIRNLITSTHGQTPSILHINSLTCNGRSPTGFIKVKSISYSLNDHISRKGVIQASPKRNHPSITPLMLPRYYQTNFIKKVILNPCIDS